MYIPNGIILSSNYAFRKIIIHNNYYNMINTKHIIIYTCVVAVRLQITRTTMVIIYALHMVFRYSDYCMSVRLNCNILLIRYREFFAIVNLTDTERDV